VSLIAFAVSAFFYPVAYRFDFYYIAGLAVAAKNICDHEIEGAVSVFGAAPAPGTRRTA